MKTAGLLSFISKFRKPAVPALTGAQATAAKLLKTPNLFKVKPTTTPATPASLARADIRTRLASAKYASMRSEMKRLTRARGELE